ncbi:polysaccharide pyruvyl transferase family protein [Nocardioides astragali]|uniref:Polysaccharide pyruvyl transferase family protein n=1 Tax=Nocardioides astragali TaxID=1776736 RepID=A0ABW2N0I3_9ACTN|nr:polysaccharide pyruvyl transferase family protein [Nocardioides astragali]
MGFFGILGSGNLGNDGSLAVLVSFLRQRYPDTEVDFFAMGPGVLQSRYGAPATSLQWYEANAARFSAVPAPALKAIGRLLDPLRTLTWVRGHDAVLVPGMGVLETTTPSRPWGLPLSLWCLAVAGRLTGARVGLVAVGADVISPGMTRWLITSTARLVHFRSYRDELSRDAMLAMGVEVARTDSVYPDLAFALPTPARRQPHPRSIAIGVMNFRGAEEDRPRAQEMHDRYVAGISHLVAGLLDDDWQVRLFGGDVEDWAIVELIAARMRQRPSPSVLTTHRCASMDDVMSMLVDVGLVVATRYHSVQAALRTCVPTVAIGYARKSDILMESVGLGDYCHHAADFDVDEVIDQVRRLDAQHDEVAQMLAGHNEQQERALGPQFEALSSFLRSAAPPRAVADGDGP